MRSDAAIVPMTCRARVRRGFSYRRGPVGRRARVRLPEWGRRILTPHQPSVILPLLMSRERVISVLIVAGVVFLAPVAMAFGTCAAMTAMCEGPCGASSCGAVPIAPQSIWLGSVSDLAPQPAERLPAVNLSSLDPPPKPVLLSA